MLFQIAVYWGRNLYGMLTVFNSVLIPTYFINMYAAECAENKRWIAIAFQRLFSLQDCATSDKTGSVDM